MIPNHLNFAYLKRRVSIVTVLNTKGVMTQFKKRGDQLFGPCPVHGGDNPNAFVISLSKNIWHCFTRCNTGGDVIKLVQHLYGKDYQQTAAFLSSLADTADKLQLLAAFALPIIVKNPSDPSQPVCGWMLQPHGCTKNRSIRLQPVALKPALITATGFLTGCIAVRLHDLLGHPIGYAGRQLNPTLAKQYGKWKFPPGLAKNEILYNFHRIRSANPKAVVVVECPWGVMRLAQLNIPAVALLGIHLSSLQLDILKKISRVVLMLDGDYAGRSATNRVHKTLEPYTKVHCITLPHES